MRSKFDVKKQLKEDNRANNVVSDMLGLQDVMKKIPYTQLEFGEYSLYDIDLDEVKELAQSIATIGLEQNLVVKATDNPNKYVIVTGHKRTTAIRYIYDNKIPVSNKIQQDIFTPLCKVVPADENSLITRIRMHETNIQGRIHLDIKDIEDYYNTVQLAKDKGIKVNGHEIKGTSRAILHSAFGISESMAKKYIKIFKEGTEEMKEQINNGEISVNHAYNLLNEKSKPKENEDDKPKENEDSKEYGLEELGIDIKKIYNNAKKMAKNIEDNKQQFSVEIDDKMLDKYLYEELSIISASLKNINKLIIKADSNK